MHFLTVAVLGLSGGQEREIQEEAGFTKVEIEQLPHDFQNYYRIATIS